MSDEPRVSVNFPFALHQTRLREARILEDFLSTEKDLQYTEGFLSKSIELHGNPDFVTAALFSAAHMSYRRCFNRGARGLGKNDLKLLNEEQLATHNYHYSQADKLIAHSVNGFEMVHVGIGVEDGEPTVGFVRARLIGLDKPDLENWLALVRYIHAKILTPKIEHARKITLERFKQIPISEIQQAPVIQGRVPNKPGASTKR